MTWTYGTRTNANIEKDLEVTAAKHKIKLTVDIWLNGSSHECYAAIYDSTGTIIPMLDNSPSPGYWDSTYGNYLTFNSGVNHREWTFERLSGVDYTIGEILTVRFKTTPWATDNPMYFYEIKLELID